MTQVLTSIQLGVRGMLSFAMDVPGFQELDSEDQASLLKGKTAISFSQVFTYSESAT
ncbi:hypothetical protein DPMN_010147 [Dreissena polymorpha]|uniref:Uncharacterized protein n=1 Tax=Dreissena polymorpha TaxID=45954 RepID=A0A9D4N0Z5_DREPO|nr:hypothetical protein DPMN_010147 [Dreissena polymorpha]